MRTPPAGFQTAIASENVRIAEIYDFVLQSGEQFYFTTHTKAITWNSIEYTPLPLQRGEIGYKLNLEADSVKVNMAGITGSFVSLLQANAVDNVEMTVRTVIWDDVSDPLDVMIEFQGTGDVEFDRREVTFTFKSILDNLNIVVPKNLFQEQCNNRLFDDQCKVPRFRYQYSGSASDDGGDNFTLIDTVRGQTNKAAFDAGDFANNPIQVGDNIETYVPPGLGNSLDESGDDSCKAWWRHEAGVEEIDSIGTNDLTPTSMTASTTEYFEGAAGGNYFVGTKMVIADADLDSGFPCKSGETNGSFTICFRYKLKTVTSNQTVIYKYGSTPSPFENGLRITVGSGNVALWLGKNSTAGATYQFKQLLGIDAGIYPAPKWNSVGITYNDSTKAFRIRVKNGITGYISELTGFFDDNIYINDKPFTLGGSYYGYMDDVIVFDDDKSVEALDAIFNQSYPTEVTKTTAKCVAIAYDTNTTGNIWYVEEDGTPFIDGDIVTNEAGLLEIVTLNGDPAEDGSFYTLGEIEMTSGLNDGFRRMVILSSTNDLIIVNAFPNEIQAGDTYNLYPGCGQSAEVCGGVFDNEPNYTGYLHVPKPEEAMT